MTVTSPRPRAGSPNLQREFDRLYPRILTERETEALFNGEPVTRRPVPFTLYVVIIAAVVYVSVAVAGYCLMS